MKTITRLREKGATLLEILISGVIFTIMMLVLISITHYAIESWKSVEDRVEIQTKIRRIETSLTTDILNTSYSSVLVYPPEGQDDSIHAVAMKTYKDPATGHLETDESGLPVCQGYIIYLLVRPTDDPLRDLTSSVPPPSVTDNSSPYKILVKIELTKTTDGVNTWEPLEIYDDTGLREYIPPAGYYFRRQAAVKGGAVIPAVTVKEYTDAIGGSYERIKYVNKVTLMATDVLSFDVKKKPDNKHPEVRVDLRFFKIRETQKKVKFGADDLTDSKYTINIRTNLIPRNP